ncbi:MAG: hypothetical protein M1816_001195 [Peltula sp. TS41687]|nr:MAG: hypothetical protein M1816_001195 [Peltula sp. TS41687]
MRPFTILALATVWLASTLAFSTGDTKHGSHLRSDVALQRRTNGPPGRRLSINEWFARTEQANAEITLARRKDPALWNRFIRNLGGRFSKNEGALIHVTRDEVNNALRRAGYEGILLPGDHELDDYSEEMMQDYRVQSQRAHAAIEELRRRRDPGFTRRFRKALGIDPEGPWPIVSLTSRHNRALKEAGYTGPPLPKDPREPQPDEGEGSGGPRTSGGPNRLSLDQDHPQSGFFPSAVQSVREAVSKRFSDFIGKMAHPAGSTSPQPLPMFPFKSPLGALRPI